MSKKVLAQSDQTELQKAFGKVDAEMGDGFQKQYNRVVEHLQEIAIKG